MTTLLLLILGAIAGVVVVAVVYHRPQWGLLLLAAFTPFNGLIEVSGLPGIVAGWKEGLLALTLICAALQRVSRRDGLPMHIPWWPAMAGLCVVGVVSAIATYGPYGAVALKVTFFYLLVLAVLWMAPFDARDRDLLVSVVMGAAALTVLVGILQQIVGPATLIEWGYQYGKQVRSSGSMFRTFSTFNQPFGFGLYVMMALLVGGAVAMADPTRRRNKWFLLASPIMALTMATSVVRAAILGLAVGVVWLAAMRFRWLFGPIIGMVVVAAGAVAVLPGQLGKVFLSSSSLGERSSGWNDIFASIGVRPFGRGLGSSGAAADRMATAQGGGNTTVTAGAGGTVQSGSANYQPDNYYIKVLLELGPIGLWLFLAVVITALVWCVRSARRLPDPDGALVLGISASIVAALCASMFATYFEIFPMDLYFWLLLGATGCATAQHDSHTGRWRYAPMAAESKPTSANFLPRSPA